MHGTRARRRSALVATSVALALASVAPDSVAAASIRVTAVTGKAGARGVPLERSAELSDGDSLQTGHDGACSLLVDGDAVLELCQGTSLRLGRASGDAAGPRVLELQRGEIRVVAGTRPADRRIEVHTPAAIATLLGAIVYVAVDAKGVTTIASAEGPVRVESARRLGSPVTLEGGRQLTIRPGAPLARASSPWNPETSPADGCLVDFRALAFEQVRPRGDLRVLDAVTLQDLADGLPQVGAASERPLEPPALLEPWIDPRLHQILEPTDTGAVVPPGAGTP